MLERVKTNEYLCNNETFETFVLRKLDRRPGKRIVFSNKKESQKELFQSYLIEMREKEIKRLAERQAKIDAELSANQQALAEVEKEGNS